jgi:glycogen synthase
MERLAELEEEYQETLIIIPDERRQKLMGNMIRAAADWAFVPSIRESFGLVAAEGLLFGAAIISTGAGGLKEFLIDRPSAAKRSTSHYNSYLFRIPTHGNGASLGQAISDAANDYHRMMLNVTEFDRFRWSLIMDAINLDWTDQEFPLRVYAKNGNAGIMVDRDNGQNQGKQSAVWKYSTMYSVVLQDLEAQLRAK